MRRVVVHTAKRGKRLSRYSHFNEVLKQAKKFNAIKDRDEANRQIDNYFRDSMRYSDARCVHVSCLLVKEGKLDISPFRLTSFDEFHARCGRYVLYNSDYAHSHVDDIVKYSGKMNHILRREKPKYKFREACYQHTGNVQFVITAETYNTIKQGVQEALERLKFDPVRDFNENTVGLMEAMWNINKLSNKDEPK